MQWSKLKSRVRDCISPELKDRIDFHLTSYRKSHDEADKVWITIDGERIFSCKHYPYEFGERELCWFDGLNLEEAKTVLNQNELHKPKEFGEAMRIYLDLPIEEALQSSNPFIKAFALIDRRTGKRTIEKIKISDSEHTLVKAFYNLRN
jgi:hypothetical protein